VRQKLIRVAMITVLMVGAVTAVCAQAPELPPPPHGGFGGPGPGGPGDGMFAFEGMVGSIGEKAVTGSPFTAVVTSEHVQKLVDGNTIDNKTTGNIARDSSGRTRRDITLPSIGLLATSGQPQQMISITDPVARTHYILNVARKTYVQFSSRPRDNFPARLDNPPALPMGQALPRILSGEPGQLTTESLGVKTIDGVTAEGTRATRNIPAGAVGNANPIIITTERWYSPDLQLTVLETRTDPRFGISTFQLTNVNRNEPDPTLFAVPSDYTLKKDKGFGYGPQGLGKQPPPPPQD
jgi:hypothetical protein